MDGGSERKPQKRQRIRGPLCNHEPRPTKPSRSAEGPGLRVVCFEAVYAIERKRQTNKTNTGSWIAGTGEREERGATDSLQPKPRE